MGEMDKRQEKDKFLSLQKNQRDGQCAQGPKKKKSYGMDFKTDSGKPLIDTAFL